MRIVRLITPAAGVRRTAWTGLAAALLALVTVAPAAPATSAAAARPRPDDTAHRASGVPPFSRPSPRRAVTALRAYARQIDDRLAGYRRWGVPPTPIAPAPVRSEPRARSGGPGAEGGVEVVRRVPTSDRVIFLTADDGVVHDPEFLRMVRDLRLPVTSFLTDDSVGGDYRYFRRLQQLGNHAHNHTLHHPDLAREPYAAQREEICQQQHNLTREFGETPRLFRPPFGNLDGDTLRAVRDCGLEKVVLWTVEAHADRIDFRSGDRLRPGDIVLTHFNGPEQWDGTMADMTRRLLRLAADQGFAVARLEDYL